MRASCKRGNRNPGRTFVMTFIIPHQVRMALGWVPYLPDFDYTLMLMFHIVFTSPYQQNVLKIFSCTSGF